MIYGKPTIVVGQKGFAGIVSPESIQEIAYYNFSGRNQQTPCSPEILAENIGKLISNAELRHQLGAFGKKFILEEVDVKLGLPRIENVYQKNIQGRTFSVKIFSGSLFLLSCYQFGTIICIIRLPCRSNGRLVS
jgi:hypothetical protein